MRFSKCVAVFYFLVENMTSPLKNQNSDQESNGTNKAGSYNFEWANSEDYFDGLAMDLDATDIP